MVHCFFHSIGYESRENPMAYEESENRVASFEHIPAAEQLISRKATADNAGDQVGKTSTFPDTEKDVSNQIRDLTSRLLDFLSHASNETLAACLVALVASTWLILGRVGLLLIGGVGGVILHATWEGNSQDYADKEVRALEARKRREKGLDIASRVLDWRGNVKQSSTISIFELGTQKISDFGDFRPETRNVLNILTDTVIRDYVKYAEYWIDPFVRVDADVVRFWYGPVLPSEESFPASCRQILTSFLLALSNHLSRKRPADTFLDFLTNSSSILIVFFSELSTAFRASTPSANAPVAINEFLDANPSSGLANILDVRQQEKKLRAVAEDILQTFLEPKAYMCEPIRIFLREIMAGVILEMTIASCSRGEFINDWIIYSLEEAKTEIIQNVDVGVNDALEKGVRIQPNQAERARSEDTDASKSLVNGLHSKSEHKRTVSRAENAMEEAMQEAKRLSELIAAEEAKKERSSNPASSSESSSAVEMTPTSSHDDLSVIRENHLGLESDRDTVLPKAEVEEANPKSSFTTFDQIISTQQPTALQLSSTLPILPLTLHNANVSIFDDSIPGGKGILKSKPTDDYLLQIEPATSQYPGWMIARKYDDFDTLHEVLKRISVISGVAGFAEKYQTVPHWKNKTRADLRSILERYLRDALSFQRLAESEGMKRFLEKDQGLGKSSPGTGKGGFGFPSPAAFETVGKGMLDVLASAPKGAAGGGKAILGGVTGVLGGVGSLGQKRQPARSPAGRSDHTGRTLSTSTSTSTLPSTDGDTSARSSFAQGRESYDSSRASMHTTDSTRPPPLPRRSSLALEHGRNLKMNDTEAKNSSAQTLKDQVPQLPTQDELHLPPPPSEITDDYKLSSDSQMALPNQNTSSANHHSDNRAEAAPKPMKEEAAPLNSQETSVAVELFFAIVNELYTLSSAWTLRLTLLNAAKSFLLRPGNPNLEAIRLLLQTTVIEANTTDAGIAAHLQKLRQNAMPSEEELKNWPPPLSEEEKEHKRQKARKLLVEKGMPQALTSVMGAAASGEALGRVFDCLQVPEVARGLVFALTLQGVRAITQ